MPNGGSQAANGCDLTWYLLRLTNRRARKQLIGWTFQFLIWSYPLKLHASLLMLILYRHFRKSGTKHCSYSLISSSLISSSYYSDSSPIQPDCTFLVPIVYRVSFCIQHITYWLLHLTCKYYGTRSITSSTQSSPSSSSTKFTRWLLLQPPLM